MIYMPFISSFINVSLYTINPFIVTSLQSMSFISSSINVSLYTINLFMVGHLSYNLHVCPSLVVILMYPSTQLIPSWSPLWHP